MTHSLATPLEGLEALEAKVIKALAKASFTSVGDVLTHFPRRYEDRHTFAGFPYEELEDAVCLHGMVTDCGIKKFGWKRYAEIRLEDATEAAIVPPPIWCRWFNAAWMAKAFAVGQEIIVYGKVKAKSGRLVIDHPDYEIIERRLGEISLHMDRVVPVYALRSGLTQKPLREAAHRLLDGLAWDEIPDLLPPNALNGLGHPTAEGEPSAPAVPLSGSRAEAMRSIHFPASLAAAEAARRYLALEEFFALQLNVLSRRQDIITQPGTAHTAPGTLLDRWLASLPFSLTGAQLRVIAEIRIDMARVQPMNRLVQGDVGSGKTFVALAAALVAVESGSQVALMAPTQILAEQHFLNFQKHLSPLGIRLALRTGSRQEESHLPLFDDKPDAPTGVQIIIGTHALLFETEIWTQLGLVIVDEQHKFGVSQRAKLAQQGTAPDVLVMTATPIPRTLALTVYGDLDVSLIDEMPAGRGKLTTAARAGADLTQVTSFIQQQIDKGRQVFLIFPLVEESDKITAKAAKTEFETWQQRLPQARLGLLHGKLAPEAKDAVMAAFRRHELDVLVSTTVVEVGVDVPNANLIVIFNAERFGLAQLHQLRGRVGRGEHHSYCILLIPEKNEIALARLKILEATRDGFRIAEEDLRLRGPGELLGERQAGLADLQCGDLATDTTLVQHARTLAAQVIAEDPTLSLPQHTHLRPLIQAIDARTAGN
jgi:ATP-dependent DNA helicase RecG